MKNILVVTSRLPFVYGGNELLAKELVEELRKRDFNADLFYTPSNRFGRQFSSYLANWSFDGQLSGLDSKIDRIITMRYPSYAVRHPDHICWHNHWMREYYDLWENFYSTVKSPIAKLKERIRKRAIHFADAYFLKKVRIYAQSKNIQHRLLKFLNLNSEVLYPPPSSRLIPSETMPENLILCVARFTPQKRVNLLISALALIANLPFKCLLAGSGPLEDQLKKEVSDYNLNKRVEFLGFVDFDTLNQLYSQSLMVFNAPYDEDYGLVTVEAMKMRKAVITCADSGGAAELVQEGKTGFILPSNPEIIAQAMKKLLENPELAIKMGEEGAKAIQHITWDYTIAKLTSD